MRVVVPEGRVGFGAPYGTAEMFRKFRDWRRHCSGIWAIDYAERLADETGDEGLVSGGRVNVGRWMGRSGSQRDFADSRCWELQSRF